MYDHGRGKTVKGYELLGLALLTPGNLFPLDFGFHFSKHALAEARQSQPRRPRGYLARHLKAERRTKIELSLQRLTQTLAQGVKATWLLGRRLVHFPEVLRRGPGVGPARHRSPESRRHPLYPRGPGLQPCGNFIGPAVTY